MIARKFVSLGVVAGALAVTPAALGASAPFKVQGSSKSSNSFHTTFSLPSAFKPAAGANGIYRRSVHLSTYDCTLTIQAGGHARSARPTVRNSVFPAPSGVRFKVTKQGRRGGLRWFTGRSHNVDYAAAYTPAPRGVAPAKDKWVLFEMTLESETGPQAADQQACKRLHSDTVSILRQAIRSARVTRTK